MHEFTTTLCDFLTNQKCLFILFSASCIFKVGLISLLAAKIIAHKRTLSPSLIYFMFVLLGAFSEDVAWAFSTLYRSNFLPDLPYFPVLFTVRVAWAGSVVMYQSFALFITGFSKKKYSYSWVEKLFITCSVALITLFVAVIFYGHASVERSSFEQALFSFEPAYTMLFLIPFAIYSFLKTITQDNLPRILHAQLKAVVQFVLIPYALVTLIQVYPFHVSFTQQACNLVAMV